MTDEQTETFNFQNSQLSETEPEIITFTGLFDALVLCGAWPKSKGAFSKFLNIDGVRELLGGQKVKQEIQYPVSALGYLKRFLPLWIENSGKDSAVLGMLTRLIESSGPSFELRNSEPGDLVLQTPLVSSFTTSNNQALELESLVVIAEAQGRAQGSAHAIYSALMEKYGALPNAHQSAEILGLTIRKFNRAVKAGLVKAHSVDYGGDDGKRWRLTDLLS